MPTTEDLLTFLELRSGTAHDRCGELIIRSEFDRLIAILMAHTYVSMLPEIHRTGSVQDGVELGERAEFARRTLRDCHTYWSIEEGGDHDPDAFRFFHNLARGTVEDFWGCMSPEAATFWASQGLYENGAFMRYITPALAVIRQFLDDNAGVAQTGEASA